MDPFQDQYIKIMAQKAEGSSVSGSTAAAKRDTTAERQLRDARLGKEGTEALHPWLL